MAGRGGGEGRDVVERRREGGGRAYTVGTTTTAILLRALCELLQRISVLPYNYMDKALSEFYRVIGGAGRNPMRAPMLVPIISCTSSLRLLPGDWSRCCGQMGVRPSHHQGLVAQLANA